MMMMIEKISFYDSLFVEEEEKIKQKKRKIDNCCFNCNASNFFPSFVFTFSFFLINFIFVRPIHTWYTLVQYVVHVDAIARRHLVAKMRVVAMVQKINAPCQSVLEDTRYLQNVVFGDNVDDHNLENRINLVKANELILRYFDNQVFLNHNDNGQLLPLCEP